jgi:hypothetical protein
MVPLMVSCHLRLAKCRVAAFHLSREVVCLDLLTASSEVATA